MSPSYTEASPFFSDMPASPPPPPPPATPPSEHPPVSKARVEMTPQDNIPLPPELRVLVLEHLLTVCRLSDQQPLVSSYQGPQGHFGRFAHRITHIPHLHTAIMAVNQNLRSEAEDVLYHSNAFVLVEHDSGALEALINQLSIPMIVADPDRMQKLHALRALRIYIKGISLPSPVQPVVCKFFMLLEDVPRLCIAVQLYLAGSLTTAHVFVPGSGSEQNSILPSVENHLLVISITRNASHHAKGISTSRLKKHCLEPFLALNAGQLKIKLTNFDDKMEGSVMLQPHGVSGAIWLNAFLWNMVEILHDAVFEVADLLHNRRFQEAQGLIAAQNAFWQRFEGQIEVADVLTNLETGEPIMRWMILLMDLATVMVRLDLAFGRLDDGREEFNAMRNIHSYFEEDSDVYASILTVFPDGAQEFRKHVGLRWCAALITMFSIVGLRAYKAIEPLFKARRVLAWIAKRTSVNPRIVEDSKVVDNLYNHAVNASRTLDIRYKFEELREMLHLTEVTGFDVLVTPGILHYQVPEGMVGWTDVTRQRLIDERKAREAR